MEDTLGVGRLDFASEETDKVRAVCESMKIDPIQPGLGKKEVLFALEACWIFHYAGHDRTHPRNLLQSQLLLKDWENDPLTVASLLEVNLCSRSPFLAYLSACGTSQVLNKGLIHEGIHLTTIVSGHSKPAHPSSKREPPYQEINSMQERVWT